MRRRELIALVGGAVAWHSLPTDSSPEAAPHCGCLSLDLGRGYEWDRGQPWIPETSGVGGWSGCVPNWL